MSILSTDLISIDGIDIETLVLTLYVLYNKYKTQRQCLYVCISVLRKTQKQMYGIQPSKHTTIKLLEELSILPKIILQH